MADKKPVILYGASGFSGRLVAEFLREYNVSFIAAGRSRTKIEGVMNRVPGAEFGPRPSSSGAQCAILTAEDHAESAAVPVCSEVLVLTIAVSMYGAGDKSFMKRYRP